MCARLICIFWLCVAFCLTGSPVRGNQAQDLKKLNISKTFSASELGQITRLRAGGFSIQPRIYIRLFKLEKEVEVWILSKGHYKLYRSYDICKYSGELGPKLEEGDRQAPEGFYHLPMQDVLWRSKKWPQALNLNFPNIFDAQQGRTGSYLLIHGGCSSKGCYALENGPMADLFALVSLSARGGQKVLPVHIFPFRFGKNKWPLFKSNRWAPFWKNLQPAYDYFNRNRNLPTIFVCDKGYLILPTKYQDDGVKPFGQCAAPLPLMSAPPDLLQLDWIQALHIRYKKRGALRAKARTDHPDIKVQCNLKRPSCRKWLALKRKQLARKQKKR